MAQVGQRPTLDIQAPYGGSVISLLLAEFQVVLNFPPNQMARSQPGRGGIKRHSSGPAGPLPLPCPGSLQVDPGPLAASSTVTLCTWPPAPGSQFSWRFRSSTHRTSPSCLQHPFPAAGPRMCVLLEETQAPNHIKSFQGREKSVRNMSSSPLLGLAGMQNLWDRPPGSPA